MDSQQENRQKKHVIRRILICTLILATGWAGMNGLAALKQPPVEVVIDERALTVQAMRVQPQDYPVAIIGFGEARALTVVAVSPEVSGRVVETHPNLRTGMIVPAGEVLFQIDPSDYQAGLQQADAGVDQWRNVVARLQKQLAIDSQRLKTLQRIAQLAKTDYERTRLLFETDRVGTQSGVDQAERVFNQAVDQADQIAQAVSLYPLQIREAESHLRSATAGRLVAEINLSRCTIRAPFDARIQSVSLESGQLVAPGQTVLTLADDTILEIEVPLDSRDARYWLEFEEPLQGRSNIAWFADLKPVRCTIRWTEDKTGSGWQGVLDRVVAFDRQTRTLTVAVRVEAAAALANGHHGLPLVEGMFCMVEIPGRTMHQVFRLPMQAVSFENQVYLADTRGRLKTVDVSVARIQGEHVYVSRGLNPGDTVILTRLVDPLEQTLLIIEDITVAKESAS